MQCEVYSALLKIRYSSASIPLFKMTLSCSYSALLNKPSPYGLSSDYPGHDQLECVALKDCTKDITGHLRSYKLNSDEGVATELRLLFARAGRYLFRSKMPLCDLGPVYKKLG